MKRSSRPRKTANFSDSIHHQLNMYALAATAAGVSLLALAQPSEAKIVYTPANVRLHLGKPYSLDLNHDGIVDFFLLYQRESSATYLRACHVLQTDAVRHGVREVDCWLSATGTNSRNAIRVTESKNRSWGAALHPGVKIQHGDQFLSQVAVNLASILSGPSGSYLGPWLNGGNGVKNRYLGIKFKIDGSFHFGWARVTVKTGGRGGFSSITLTGYAYETIPNKPIIAGQTKGPDDSTVGPSASLTDPASQPAALGLLALGSPGLSIWRREERAAAPR
jgi:hypothetical protein